MFAFGKSDIFHKKVIDYYDLWLEQQCQSNRSQTIFALHYSATILYYGEEPKSELRVQVCNSIPTRGVGSAHQITACPPGFENLTASLNSANVLEELNNYYNAKYAPEPPVQQHGALPSGSSDPSELDFDAIYQPN